MAIRRTLSLLSLLAALAACAGDDGTLSAVGDAHDGAPDTASNRDIGGEPDGGAFDGGDDAPGDASTTADVASDVPPAPPSDPGRVTVHRLNRTEYNNTVRDLLGTSLRPADDFPDDDQGHGFDNIADVLSISPLHLELYALAAERLVDEALAIPLQAPIDERHEAESASATVGAVVAGGTAWNLWSNGVVQGPVRIPEAGRYELTAVVWASQAGDEPARAAFTIDEAPVATFDVLATDQAAAQVLRFEIELDAGGHSIGVGFLNDFYDADASLDRNLYVDRFGVQGPVDFTARTNPLRDRLVTCVPSGDDVLPCIRTIVADFATRAWRRPATEDEIERLVDVAESVIRVGDDFELALSFALQATLLSPHFVYRVERDPDPASLEPHLLSDWELASRLSYFLWSSMPDETLFALAADGTLHDPTVLSAQVDRMLDDPRSSALVDNFAGQWLFIRAVGDAAPDPWAYPGFDDELRSSMMREMQLFFASFIEEDRSLIELLTADDTFVDPRLAAHYGLEGVAGPGFERAVFAGVPRGGLLTQAGLLTALSYPTRTSPVRRGRFVLGQLLCADPDPPPAGVEGLPDTPDVQGLPLRERMAIHMANPECSVCHASMDPLGFALEHYDGLGAWRNAYPEGVIDATGTLPDGRSFDGAQAMAEVIGNDPAFARCVATKLYTYALGRGPGRVDARPLAEIVDGYSADGFRFRDLARRIVLSEPFRMRRGEEEPDPVDEAP